MRSFALALVLGLAALAAPAVSSTAEANPGKVSATCSETVAYRGHYRYHGHGGHYWHRGHYYRHRGC